MIWFIVIGIANGMRTMTPIAVLCWFAWLKLVPQTGWAFWVGNIVSVIVFTCAALAEYYGDTRPEAPNRTSPPLLIARLAFGTLAALLVGKPQMWPPQGAICFGIIGVLLGAYGGMHLRLWGARKLGRDLPVALTESAIALALAVTACIETHVYLSEFGSRTFF